MINHYINFISWNYFLEKTFLNTKINKFHCDSLSLYLYLKFFLGKKIILSSGLKKMIEINKKNDFFILTGSNLVFTRKIPIYLLKKYTLKNIILDKEIINFIQKNENIPNLVIGISTPKQNELALKINELFPKLNIFCLGASLKIVLDNKYKFVKKNHTPNFIIFMLLQPKRTIVKIFLTFKYMIIAFLKNREFKRFSNLFL